SPGQARPRSAASQNPHPSRPNSQPWGKVGATSRSKWKKSDDPASDNELCIICHEERSRDSCELECGHHFHRECIGTWLKEHSSTCPICRVHTLLPEDFPELSPRNKYV
ncbi:DZIP3 ligase, partial [Nothoprocta ornata]|nr:DZIP3 ligase [Nothoprocta ornata]